LDNSMKHHKKTLGTACLLLLLLSFFLPAKAVQNRKLTAAQAKDHVGERATVCGTVASAHYAQKAKGAPTFLNFEKPFPRQPFTVVIWGNDRPKFGRPEADFRGRKICVTGEIKLFRNRPEMAVKEPKQISEEGRESIP
jgi:hypothetical protein